MLHYHRYLLDYNENLKRYTINYMRLKNLNNRMQSALSFISICCRQLIQSIDIFLTGWTSVYCCLYKQFFIFGGFERMEYCVVKSKLYTLCFILFSSSVHFATLYNISQQTNFGGKIFHYVPVTLMLFFTPIGKIPQTLSFRRFAIQTEPRLILLRLSKI